MKKLLITVLLLLGLNSLFADISVKSFHRLENDMDARVTEPLKDQNGDMCAIIKVVTTQTGFSSFDCGLTGVMKTVQKNAEIWVYVPYGAKRITITHPILGVLRDYFFPEPITKATVYEMVLTTAKVITTIDESIDSHYLLIHAEPNKAMIYLNDQFVTIGEYQSKLIPGTYTYRVEMPMYHTEAGKIEITDSKQVLNVKLKPAFGTALITTSPDSSATVLIDGKVQSQTTPCESEALVSGEHTVQVVKEMYQPAAQKITITDGKTTALNVVLQPNFADVSITAPTDATLFINNQQKGVGRWQGRLNTGIYTIEARQDKHYPIQQDIEVKAGDKRTIDLQPTPIYGSLDITTKPAGAIITINGTTYGNTPNIVKNLLIGDYIVLLSKTGYTSIAKTVTITDGKSTDLMETLVIGNDQTAEKYYKSGKAKFELKDYKGSIIDYSKAIEIDHKNAEAYYCRGDAKTYLDDYQGAIADYSKAIEIDPKYTVAYIDRGDTKAYFDDYKGSIIDFSKAIEIDPKNAVAYLYRGIAKFELKDYKGAIIDYSKAIEIDPKNADAYKARGIAKYNLKDNQGAIADYSKAIEIDPKNANAYKARGDAKYNLKDNQGAIADYSKAIEIDPKNAVAYISRGNSKIALGQKTSACSDYSKAGELGYADAYEAIKKNCQ